jgi:hypothetical protein
MHALRSCFFVSFCLFSPCPHLFAVRWLILALTNQTLAGQPAMLFNGFITIYEFSG